jgi:hypothetical protein
MFKKTLATVAFTLLPFVGLCGLSVEEQGAILAKLKGTWVVTTSKALPSSAKEGKIIFEGHSAKVEIVWSDGRKSEWRTFFSEIDQDKIYLGDRKTGEKGAEYKLRGEKLNVEWMIKGTGGQLEDVVLERVDRLMEKASGKPKPTE